MYNYRGLEEESNLINFHGQNQAYVDVVTRLVQEQS